MQYDPSDGPPTRQQAVQALRTTLAAANKPMAVLREHSEMVYAFADQAANGSLDMELLTEEERFVVNSMLALGGLTLMVDEVQRFIKEDIAHKN